MSRYWNEYVKASYDLILESEGISKTYLQNEVEAYVVHLFAKHFERTDIGQEPVAIKILTSLEQKQARSQYQAIADECLLIDSYPLKKRRWPTETYYRDMGTMAYALAHIDLMERHFDQASRVLNTVFNRIG